MHAFTTLRQHSIQLCQLAYFTNINVRQTVNTFYSVYSNYLCCNDPLFKYHYTFIDLSSVSFFERCSSLESIKFGPHFVSIIHAEILLSLLWSIKKKRGMCLQIIYVFFCFNSSTEIR